MIADFRYALRSLRRWPVGSLMAIVTLTIAIGAATSLYTFLSAVVSIQAPHIPGIDRLARVYVSSAASGADRSAVPLTDFDSALSTASSFESIAAYQSSEAEMLRDGATARVDISRVSASFFDVLGATAASGRLIGAEDSREHALTMVVSDAFWREHFEGSAVGESTVVLDGTLWTVAGVLPPAFGSALLGIHADIYVPMSSGGKPPKTASIIGRLKADRSWSAARAELQGLASGLSADRRWTWRIIPVTDDLNARIANAAAMVLGPALILLLIGCVNVSCMLLARGIERREEIAVRSALGASRARIVRQLVSEQLVLAGIAGVLGCGLAMAILRFLESRMAVFPAAPPLAPNVSILGVTIAVTITAALLFGAWPAIRDSRRDVGAVLHGATEAPARAAGYHARDLVVFTELALAVVLIVVAALWLTLFGRLQSITPAFPADRLIAARVSVTDMSATLPAIAAVPGISEVTLASHVPGQRASGVLLRASNGRIARGAQIGVQPTYFSTVGLTVKRGRTFDATEASTTPVVVISESLAAALFAGEDAIGAKIKIGLRTGEVSATVIGVSADALQLGSLGSAGIMSPDFYLPLDMNTEEQPVVIARTMGDAHPLLKSVERILGSLAASRAVVLADELRFVPEQSVFLVRMMAAFGLAALLLAASGVFGVISQSVSQRTAEFGVRMAVGATPASILVMVINREVKLIAAALLSGALLTVFVTRAVFAELIAVAGVDPRLWLGVAVLCGGASALAVTIATRRIVRLDPASVLRHA